MRLHARSIIAAAVLAAMLAGTATAGPSGAIFTTDAGGNWVNNNVYDSPQQVFLNGGPRANQNCTAAGLPNGTYYFQVTDPSGKERLSGYGHENGIIHVDGGVITDYEGDHEMGTGRCGDVTVQVWPFGLTSNPGGEYKVWLTRTDTYACVDPLTVCGGTFGFFSSSSKTDTFKVQPSDEPD
jgi:hypothetical protein